MKFFFHYIIISYLLIFTGVLSAADDIPRKQNDVAVIKAEFEKIEKALSRYKISYKLYNYTDLSKEEIFKNHNVIFFSCGIEKAVETNIDILSRGTSIQSVKLKEDFIDINNDIIYENIKSFLKNGGNAYFSDYSFKILQDSLHIMDFYNDFPNLGKTGMLRIKLYNDLRYFCNKDFIDVFMPHQGWIVLKYIKNANILGFSEADTIKGLKESPIISRIREGKGQAFYTSYHKDNSDDELLRFVIYRICYSYYAETILKKISFWEQKENCTIIDSVREWEDYRSYTLPVTKGSNTIYFNADQGNFQIDISDERNAFLLSRSEQEKYFTIVIKSEKDQNLNLKVFPGVSNNRGVFTIVSAEGMKILPYYRKIIYVLILGILVLLIIFSVKFYNNKKSPGRIRL